MKKLKVFTLPPQLYGSDVTFEKKELIMYKIKQKNRKLFCKSFLAPTKISFIKNMNLFIVSSFDTTFGFGIQF